MYKLGIQKKTELIGQAPKTQKLTLYPYTAKRRDVFPNASRLEAVYVHSLSISREVLILWCVFI